MHDVPKDLMDHIKELEKIFTIDTPKLHEIVDVFVEELKKGVMIPRILGRCESFVNSCLPGLAKEGSTIVRHLHSPRFIHHPAALQTPNGN